MKRSKSRQRSSMRLLSRSIILFGLFFILTPVFSNTERFFLALFDFDDFGGEIVRDDYLRENQSWVYPKSALVFALLKVTEEQNSASACTNNVCFQYSAIHPTIDDVIILGRASERFCGLSVIRKIDPLPNSGFLISYDAPALKKCFDMIFSFRTGSIRGKTIKKIYEEKAQKWFRRRIELTRLILTKSTLLSDLAAEYEFAARSNPDFNGTYASWTMASKFGCSVLDPAQNFNKTSGIECDDRWIGMLARRKIDGTLPVLLDILNSVMREFDPEEFEKGALRWP